MSNEKINIVNGVVLDPFAIHLTGLLRKHSSCKTGLASELFAPLHGEAKFKQAFVNACTYAESMTVVGPVAQVVWNEERPDPITQALYWAGKYSSGSDTEKFMDFVKGYMGKVGWNNVDPSRWAPAGTDEFFLHLMPDFTLGSDREVTDVNFGAWSKLQEKLMWYLYRNENHIGDFTRARIADGHKLAYETRVTKGAPTLGLLAVIFTFKKPVGILKMEELTNLGSWPPVVFFLPVMVPAGASLDAPNNSYGLIKSAVNAPAMSTYRLSLYRDKTILPFAQPYYLSTVEGKGKPPDILRSLADVFKALWSQATQYSALNMSYGVDLEAPRNRKDLRGWDITGEFCLEPMGAGRRIRGHNRYMTKYDLSDVSFITERDLGGTPTLHEWNDGAVDKKPFRRQLRRPHLGQYETVFVTPSYLDPSTIENLKPLAMAMNRFLYVNKSGLEGFLAGKVLGSVTPTSLNTDPSPTVEKSASFMDRVSQMHGKEDNSNVGALPVHRIQAGLQFDAEGKPTVFGSRTSYDAVEAMKGEGTVTDEELAKIKDGTHFQAGFAFMDAFTSKSTKDLTEIFGEVKATSFKEGTKAKELFDAQTTINLFDADFAMI